MKSALRIVQADVHARKLGLRPGLTLADARARVPHLTLADEDKMADLALRDHIADWCDRYTPLVGLDGEDGLQLDITGCAHLFGGEADLRGDLMARLAAQGFTALSAIADTPDAARAVARYGRGGLVPSGQEREAVRPLPIAALGLEAQNLRALTRAGLTTIGDLAIRPRAPLAARFGADLVNRLVRTLGEAQHPISPRRPVPDLIATRRFAEPIALMDTVLATLRELGRELEAMLAERGGGGRHFEASLYRADGAIRRVRIETGRPLRDAAIVTRLLSERMAALADPIDPGFGFDMIRLDVLAAEAMTTVQSGLDGRQHDAESLADLIDRLSVRYGQARVLRFTSEDSHVPERMARLVPAIAYGSGQDKSGKAWLQDRGGAGLAGGSLAGGGLAREGLAGDPPAQPCCLFDPPQPIETLAEVPDGPPLRFLWRRVMHEIAAAEGPERIAPEWWRDAEGALTRDYFRVEDRNGHRFWLFREGLYAVEIKHPRWFLHGLFA
ncbi:MAG: DNA polymerase Y family protein [Chelatococcus sp.]|nr:DNA polymerase Y family protein [Chelatococcus sp. YT9]MBX3560152.1 DNA polymerase Y family protein [Chelatococcus sp.]